MTQVGEIRFVCYVNPVSAIEADARAEGWDGTNGNPGDFTDVLGHECGKAFSSLDDAARWGRQYIAAGKDYFGAAHIHEQKYGPREEIPELNGWQRTERWWECTADDLSEGSHWSW